MINFIRGFSFQCKSMHGEPVTAGSVDQAGTEKYTKKMLAFTVVKCYHIKQIKFLTNQEDSSMYAFDEIKKADSEIADAIQAEMERQNSHLELIASENWVSKAVMAAMGSPLTNKYAEGYPGKRYYGGCQCVDVVEDLARERAKKLFGCDYANVQPHSGAQANLAVFFARKFGIYGNGTGYGRTWICD